MLALVLGSALVAVVARSPGATTTPSSASSVTQTMQERPNRSGLDDWSLTPGFEHEAFTFVRLHYQSAGGRGRGGGRGFGRGGGREAWETDWPDSDLNFSLRLQQLTSLEVNPDGLILQIEDPRLFDHPFLYMIEPGRGNLWFSENEVKILRRYLLNGGFLMVDDFWGEWEYQIFDEQIRRVFPDRVAQEVPLEHEIFHCVYDLTEKPQIPSIHSWRRGYLSEHTNEPAHYRAIYDDFGRIMVFICHNTDLGDGWEREGEDVEYFHQFSEKYAYPLGINIVVYALTH